METVRGEFQNTARAKQLVSFTGLRYGNITPTDIDGLLEFQNRAWIIFETKLQNTIMHLGQTLAFERLNDDLEKSGKPCIFIVSSHQVSDVNQTILAAETAVVEYRYKGIWHQPAKTMTTKVLIEKFLRKHDLIPF